MTANDWPFDDPRNFATITTREIMCDNDWIALVSHDADDGAWQFFGLEGAPPIDQAMVVGLDELFEKDSSIAEVADLPLGWRAWRESPDAPWHRTPNDS
jgi:hypothetical protein